MNVNIVNSDIWKTESSKLVPIAVKIPRFFAWIVTESGSESEENLGLFTPKKKILRMEDYFNNKGKRPTSHRSTTYPCYVPILGDFAGADRVGLAVANIQ